MVCLVFAVPVYAAEPELILACEISGTEGGYLRLTQADGKLNYVFSLQSADAPITAFSVPLSEVAFRSWNNQRQFLSYLLVMRQGGDVYSVYASYDNWSGLDATGVTVERNEVFLAGYGCSRMTVRGDLVAYVPKHQKK